MWTEFVYTNSTNSLVIWWLFGKRWLWFKPHSGVCWTFSEMATLRKTSKVPSLQSFTLDVTGKKATGFNAVEMQLLQGSAGRINEAGDSGIEPGAAGFRSA